ncbi:glycosyltransferase WbuB [Sphingorhabdus pulchriflava]|uniref:Glycosyltransferase WbuB n=2 Tax=Sphingorhabdus pulchriflava TaxID=2292257 RepID=A0A371B1R6_9SPHN|nr:glycosyltransferase WbuB [Sphingorhabdus pulchriflava]
MPSKRHPPRLILLTQWFDPEPTFKGLLFARELRQQGFNVEVVTGFPNYPGGKLYDGYKIRPIQREVIDSIAITRLPIFPSHDRNAIGRTANYVSFFLSAALYLTFFAKRADILYVYHPPLTVGLAAAVAKIFRRTPTVVDIQDMWPDTLRATGMIGNENAVRLVGTACNWLYRQVNHIVVLSPGFKRLLEHRGVPADKVSVIYNWADEASIVSEKLADPFPETQDNKFRLLFAGNMGRAQALSNLIEAAEIVGRKRKDIEFCLLGGGLEVATLKKQVADKKLGNVSFLPHVPMSEVGPYLAHADCMLVHLRNDPLFDITIPSKTQAYMAAGKPIIMAVSGDAAELVKSAKCGLVVDPENPPALADAIMELASLPVEATATMGQNASDFYRSTLSIAKGISLFEKVFRSVIPRTQ